MGRLAGLSTSGCVQDMEEEQARMRCEIEAVRSDKHTAVADAVEAQRKVPPPSLAKQHRTSCQTGCQSLVFITHLLQACGGMPGCD
jgi:hypothetical protein